MFLTYGPDSWYWLTELSLDTHPGYFPFMLRDLQPMKCHIFLLLLFCLSFYFSNFQGNENCWVHRSDLLGLCTPRMYLSCRLQLKFVILIPPKFINGKKLTFFFSLVYKLPNSLLHLLVFWIFFFKVWVLDTETLCHGGFVASYLKAQSTFSVPLCVFHSWQMNF